MRGWMPVKTVVSSQRASADWRRSNNSALLFAQEYCVSSKMLDCVLSAAARYRNQVAKGTRDADSGVRRPMSSTNAPKPPLCRSRSVLRSTCSIIDHDLEGRGDRTPVVEICRYCASNVSCL